MSRAFGDFLVGSHYENKGVIQKPDYKLLTMQPADEWYGVIASDGIWEFLTAEDIVKFSAKKLRLKGTRETVKTLIDASRRRWAHVEGNALIIIVFHCW